MAENRSKVKMVASDQPDMSGRMMDVSQAQNTLDYEAQQGNKLWSVAEDDPNYTLQDGKIITRTSTENDSDA